MVTGGGSSTHLVSVCPLSPDSCSGLTLRLSPMGRGTDRPPSPPPNVSPQTFLFPYSPSGTHSSKLRRSLREPL